MLHFRVLPGGSGSVMSSANNNVVSSMNYIPQTSSENANLTIPEHELVQIPRPRAWPLLGIRTAVSLNVTSFVSPPSNSFPLCPPLRGHHVTCLSHWVATRPPRSPNECGRSCVVLLACVCDVLFCYVNAERSATKITMPCPQSTRVAPERTVRKKLEPCPWDRATTPIETTAAHLY